MPALPITALTERRLFNGIVNKRIKRYTTLSRTVIPEGQHQTLQEESAQLDVLTGTAGMAPFVKLGQRAILMDSLGGTSYTVSCPFINIKRTLKYSTRLAARIIGQRVFSDGGEQLREAILFAMAQDADFLNDLIDNREEWMVAMILQNNLSYSQDGYDSFTVDTGKPSGNTFTAPILWSLTDGTTMPLKDIRTVKKLIGTYRGPMPTIGICGSNAGAAITQLFEKGLIPAINLQSGVLAGGGDLRSDLEDNGMIFLGRLGNVDFYEYTGTYVDDTTGSETPLIRTDYIEFLSQSPKSIAHRRMYYGLIPDLNAIMTGQAVTKRFGISVPPKPDQGTFQGIIQTRPLPWFERADWQVSLKVT